MSKDSCNAASLQVGIPLAAIRKPMAKKTTARTNPAVANLSDKTNHKYSAIPCHSSFLLVLRRLALEVKVVLVLPLDLRANGGHSRLFGVLVAKNDSLAAQDGHERI